MRSWGSNCPALKDIDISWSFDATDEAYEALATCSELEVFKHQVVSRGRAGTCEVGSAGVAALAQGCRKLRALCMFGCGQVDSAGVMALPSSAPGWRGWTCGGIGTTVIISTHYPSAWKRAKLSQLRARV